MKRSELKQLIKEVRQELLLEEHMPQDKRIKVYDKLNKGDEVEIKFDTSIRKGTDYKTFIVSKGKTIVGKSKVERITLKSKDNPNATKYYLYNRISKPNNKRFVDFAIGDMGASIVDMKIV